MGDEGLDVAELFPDALHVQQFFHRAPALVALAPLRAWSHPDGEGLGEILVGMLLRVPPFHVPDVLARERDRAVEVAIRTAEGAKQLAPFRSLEKLVCIIESVPRFVAHVHHDLAGIFQVIHLALQALEFGVGEIKGNANHRLLRGASPFVGEIALRAELLQAFALQFPVKLLDKTLNGRSLELQPHLADGLGEDLLNVRRSFFEGAHGGRA